MTIFGWDASDYDWSRGPMSLASAHAAGIKVFTHKATEGTRVTHHQFGEGMRRARTAEIPYLGAYIVPRTPGNGGHGAIKDQVTYFLKYVSAAAPWWRTHPGWFWQIDLEIWSNGNGVYDSVEPKYGIEVARLLADTGRPSILYAPQWAYGNRIPAGPPLWASRYGPNPARPYRDVYPGDDSDRWESYSGRAPLVLQYGSKTTIGTQPYCDANAIRDEEAFISLVKGGPMARNFGWPSLDSYTIEEKVNLLLLNYCPEEKSFNGVAQSLRTLVDRPTGAGEIDYVQLAEQLLTMGLSKRIAADMIELLSPAPPVASV